jgi:glycosyltransferase involved in cell wall biosynthesis
MSTRPDISIVCPCYNEEENVEAIAAAAIAQLERCGVTFEFLFIDNASQDRTVSLIKSMCARDRRIKLIVNTRNFGQIRSPTHAIYQTSGHAVIGLCADFQDPPEMIPRFIDRWRNGADIVLGVRQSEKVGVIHAGLRRGAYWLAHRFGDYPIIPQATGFGLYSARVVDAARMLAEPEPFFRGILLETGFRVETIPYARPERTGGKSKNDFFALFDFAMSALSGSSKRLLRLPIYVGAFGFLMTFVMMAGGVAAFFFARPIAGWFIAAVVQFELALLFGFIGLVGDNVRVISERTRKTPLVVEHERVNFVSEH